jgi:flagellar FliL protein
MADKNEADDGDESAPAKSASKLPPMKTLLMIAGGVLLVVGITIGATLWLAGGKENAGDEEVVAEADAAKNDKADKKSSKKDKKGKKSKKDGKEEKSTAVVYLPLDPPFVVNFQNPLEARFLQVSMEVMARDPLVVEDVKKHMPAIRNSLVMLLSSQTQQAVATPDGKEKIRTEALAAVQKILQEHTGKPGIEQVYFTGFVMQ